MLNDSLILINFQQVLRMTRLRVGAIWLTSSDCENLSSGLSIDMAHQHFVNAIVTWRVCYKCSACKKGKESFYEAGRHVLAGSNEWLPIPTDAAIDAKLGAKDCCDELMDIDVVLPWSSVMAAHGLESFAKAETEDGSKKRKVADSSLSFFIEEDLSEAMSTLSLSKS